MSDPRKSLVDLSPTQVAAIAFASTFATIVVPQVVVASAEGRLQIDTLFSPANIAGLVVSVILAFMFYLAKSLFDASNDTRRASEEALARLDLLRSSDQALAERTELLETSSQYHGIIVDLLQMSVADQHKSVARVTPDRYLLWLIQAAELSKSYETVQRNPPSWFRGTEHGTDLLVNIRDKQHMERVRRIFVVDDPDEIKAELADNDIMNAYWQSAGTRTETYWVLAEDILRELVIENLRDIPDAVLCDRRIGFFYEESIQLLMFDIDTVADQGSHFDIVRKVFDSLDERLNRGVNTRPFHRIDPAG